MGLCGHDEGDGVVSLLNLFYRVSRREPCRICGKPDWCMHARSDGRYAGFSICSRVESSTRWGESGWLHGEGLPGPRASRSWRVDLDFGQSTRLDIPDIVQRALRQTSPEDRARIADRLGVSGVSLQRLNLCVLRGKLARRAGIRWGAEAIGFPMKRGDRISGVRLRLANGKKFSIGGGREGLFIPEDVDLYGGRLVIAEGPTDVAALLDLGVPAIGRPSAATGSLLVERVAAAGLFDQVVVFGDNGSAGERGAHSLAQLLRLYCKDVRVIFPPSGLSDARDWVRLEGSRLAFERMVAAAEPVPFRLKSDEEGVRHG